MGPVSDSDLDYFANLTSSHNAGSALQARDFKIDCFQSAQGPPCPITELRLVAQEYFCRDVVSKSIPPRLFAGGLYPLSVGKAWIQITNFAHDKDWVVDWYECINYVIAPISFCRTNKDTKYGGVAVGIGGVTQAYTVDVNRAGNDENVPDMPPRRRDAAEPTADLAVRSPSDLAERQDDVTTWCYPANGGYYETVLNTNVEIFCANLVQDRPILTAPLETTYARVFDVQSHEISMSVSYLESSGSVLLERDICRDHMKRNFQRCGGDEDHKRGGITTWHSRSVNWILEVRDKSTKRAADVQRSDTNAPPDGKPSDAYINCIPALAMSAPLDSVTRAIHDFCTSADGTVLGDHEATTRDVPTIGRDNEALMVAIGITNNGTADATVNGLDCIQDMHAIRRHCLDAAAEEAVGGSRWELHNPLLSRFSIHAPPAKSADNRFDALAARTAPTTTTPVTFHDLVIQPGDRFCHRAQPAIPAQVLYREIRTFCAPAARKLQRLKVVERVAYNAKHDVRMTLQVNSFADAATVLLTQAECRGRLEALVAGCTTEGDSQGGAWFEPTRGLMWWVKVERE